MARIWPAVSAEADTLRHLCQPCTPLSFPFHSHQRTQNQVKQSQSFSKRASMHLNMMLCRSLHPCATKRIRALRTHTANELHPLASPQAPSASFKRACPNATRSLRSSPAGCCYCRLCRGGGRGAACALGSALLEAVLEFARDALQRPHAARAGGLSPLRLLAPVDYSGHVSKLFIVRW